MNFKEIMAFNAPYNEDNFNELVKSIQIGQIVPYIGAGMSMLFKDIYPAWGAFLNKTSEKYLHGEDKALFEALDGYEEKADFLYEELGKVTFSKHMKSIFGELHLDNKHRVDFMDKSVYLMPLIFDKGLLITTNYDKVLEKNYSLYSKILSVMHPGDFEALNNTIRDRSLALFKIHGDIIAPITSIVLTKEQYEMAYGNEELIKMLTQVYQNNTILFLGCSLENDRPLELLSQVSQAGMGNYAIISSLASTKKDKRKNLEEKYYTQAILYPEGEHECVRIILERIAEIVAPEAYWQFKLESSSGGERKSLADELTDEWFQHQNKHQINNLGDRYLPDLHVELEISHVFDAIGRSEAFEKRFTEKTDLFFERMNKLMQKIVIDDIVEPVEKLKVLISEFLSTPNERLKNDELVGCLKILADVVDREIKAYRKMLYVGCDEEDKVQNQLSLLEQVGNSIEVYEQYLVAPEVKAANIPYILLDGKGGMGKSHILAHTIESRNAQGYRSILLLGQHFRRSGTPLSQILEILELKCEFKELLQALNAIGEKEQKRLVIFIDALNEGDGKTIWKDHLGGLVEELKQYPWLGLVASIRSEYIPLLMDNNSKLREILVAVKHRGFSAIEYKAVRSFFDFYGIQYSDIPMLNQEFTNPLFLRLACEAYKGKSIVLDDVSFTDIYEKYIQTLNLRICEACGYNMHIAILKEVLYAMVTYKYEVGQANNMIPQSEMLRIIMKVAEPYGNGHLLIEQLFAIGIINKSIRFDREEYIHVTYEKLEDYIYAKQLVKELRTIGKGAFVEKHKDLLRQGDRLEVFAVVLSEEKGFNESMLEICDIFQERDKNPIFVEAFISALKWRKTSTITERTFHYINSTILRYRDYTVSFYETLISIATKVKHRLNAINTVEHILKMPMADRDARFIPIFNEIYERDKSTMHQLINWCFEIKSYTNIADEAVELAAMMIATFLISSNRRLRDISTKALVSLLTGKLETVIVLLKRYEKVDDPYIYERLYAVAFGCAVSEQSEKMIEKLAKYVYKTIFEEKYVYPNILVRDYAKSIVDYAKYRVGTSIVIDMNVKPPYRSIFPDVPTDKVIKSYEYDYNAPDFKDYYWSQNDILRSMRVEYSRDGQPGGYGDFGRYTFQSYFYDWNNLDYNDLMNIAVKKIFDMGYDVEKHGEFDRDVPYDRGREKIYERIGKKYQWIALYELAAQVADKYKLSVHTDGYGNTKQMYCNGSFNPHIRDIDPTILIKGNSQNSKEKTIHNTVFQYEPIANSEWIKTFNDLPEINKMVNREYQDQTFILLNGWYSWKEETGELRYQNPKKDMWVQINSYIVKNEQLPELVNALKGKDFIGRWLAEANHNYALYNKEYYWSEGYEFFKNPYYGGEEWVQIDRYENKLSENYEVLLPTYEYRTERQGDLLEEGVDSSWHKPCSELFHGMKLQYAEGNSILYDGEGNLMCFESSELLNEDIGFFIKKENLLQYLKEKGYSIFWTILAEKSVPEEPYSKRTYDMLTKSGVYTLNNEGVLVEERGVK